MNNEEIKCSKCLINKSVSKFHKYKYSNTGYKPACKECTKKDNEKYYEKNREKILLDSKAYYASNKNRVNEHHKEYKKSNKDKIRVRQRNYLNKIRKESSLFRLKESIRASIGSSFRRNSFFKKTKTLQILGCSFEQLKEHLEKQFESWMNWDNRGKYNGEKNYGWDIDHIIPIDFATNEEDIIRLNHYTNFQPLCSYVNRHIKSNKLDFVN